MYCIVSELRSVWPSSKRRRPRRQRRPKPRPRRSPAASSASASSDKKKVSAGEEEEEVDPTHYFDQRVRELTEMKAAGKHKHLYPHKFHAALSLPHFQYEYKQLDILNGTAAG